MKTKALFFTVILVIVVFACKKDKEEAFPPGHVWIAGDYPSLTAPLNEMDNVGIGEPVFVKSAKHVGTFKPTINAVKSIKWVVKITRTESAMCETWYQWTFNSEYWSYSIPEKKYKFEWPSFPYDCSWQNDSYLNKGGQDFWPKTEVKTLSLMQNGTWYTTITCPSFNKYWSGKGNDYSVSLKFDLPTQPDLYIGKVRTWVVFPGSEYDEYELEGTYSIKTIHKTGVSKTNSSTFSTTLGLSASVPIQSITLDINKSWTKTYGESITVTEETSEEKTKTFTVPEGERWRFITIYGVERYTFTTSEGTAWTSDYLDLQSLGNFDNIIRTFLMVVKYKEGSVKSYSSDLIDAATMINVNENID